MTCDGLSLVGFTPEEYDISTTQLRNHIFKVPGAITLLIQLWLSIHKPTEQTTLGQALKEN